MIMHRMIVKASITEKYQIKVNKSSSLTSTFTCNYQETVFNDKGMELFCKRSLGNQVDPIIVDICQQVSCVHQCIVHHSLGGGGHRDYHSLGGSGSGNHIFIGWQIFYHPLHSGSGHLEHLCHLIHSDFGYLKQVVQGRHSEI